MTNKILPPYSAEPPFCCVSGMERTGTTWLTRMLADAFGRPGLTRNKSFDNAYGMKVDWAVYRLDRMKAGIRRGHWCVGQYPYPQSPIIVIVRDPRDQAVSSYYFHKETDLNAHAGWLIGQWRKFYGEWMDVGVPIVVYEHLYKRPMEILRDAIERAGLEMPSDEDLRYAISHNNFANMVKDGRKHKGMRKGKLKGWKDEMLPETANHIISVCEDMMIELGMRI